MVKYLSQTNKLKNKYILEYFLVYILVMIPSALFFPGRKIAYYFAYLIVFFIFIRKNKKFDRTFIDFFLLNIILLILQTLYFGKFSVIGAIGLFMLLTYPYFVLQIVGQRIIPVYINIVIFICNLSFIFYFPSWISTDYHKLIGSIAPTLGTDYILPNQNFIIYTWENWTGSVLRNSGAFTEPSLFTAYLNLAFILNLIETKRLLNYKNIILIIALISTFSTSGYIAFSFSLASFLIINRKNYLKLIILPLVLFLSWYLFNKLEFLERKISTHYETQIYGHVDRGRFGSARLDLEDIKQYPIIGRGIIKSTRFDEVEHWFGDEAPRVILNGVTDFTVRYGIIGTFIYLVLLFKSLRNYCNEKRFNKQFSVFVLGVLFIIAFGQNVLSIPIFLCLLYLNDIYKKKFFRSMLNNRIEYSKLSKVKLS